MTNTKNKLLESINKLRRLTYQTEFASLEEFDKYLEVEGEKFQEAAKDSFNKNV